MTLELFESYNAEQRSVMLASNAMDSTLLITGNTGTGKSHLAELLHQASPRRRNAVFHKINLATLSDTLIESELFGHERGAFTSADTKRVGRLEVSNGGTIFLDEIGELSPRMQAKLLDFIQYKRIMPVGSNREVKVDVRIIAATNRDLEAAIERGEFRADLYHRLKVFHVHLPNISAEPERVMKYAKRFIAERCSSVGRTTLSISPQVEQLIRKYSWPGNLRELSNFVEYVVGMETGSCIHLRALPPHLRDRVQDLVVEGPETPLSSAEQADADTAASPILNDAIGELGVLELPMSLSYHLTKEAFEKIYLEHALRICGGQINLTSRRTGLNKVSLTDKIKRYQINWRRLRNPGGETQSLD